MNEIRYDPRYFRVGFDGASKQLHEIIKKCEEPMNESWEDSKEFYELMQAYRLAPLSDQNLVVRRFEDVKKFIRILLTKQRDRMQKEFDIQKAVLVAKQATIKPIQIDGKDCYLVWQDGVSERDEKPEKLKKNKKPWSPYMEGYNRGYNTCHDAMTAYYEPLLVKKDEKIAIYEKCLKEIAGKFGHMISAERKAEKALYEAMARDTKNT